MALDANVPNTVKVLRQKEEIHDILGSGAVDPLAKVYDRRAQTVYNSLSLLGNADAAQVLGLGPARCDHKT